MSELIVDTQEAADQDTERTLALLGVTREQVLAEVAYRQNKKRQEALLRMAAAQRAGGERRGINAADVNGYCEMMIDPVSYHYWGQRLGYACWEDAQFRREYLRDNPASRVRTTSSPTLCLAGKSYLSRKQARVAVRADKGRTLHLAHPVPGRARRGRWA